MIAIQHNMHQNYTPNQFQGINMPPSFHPPLRNQMAYKQTGS